MATKKPAAPVEDQITDEQAIAQRLVAKVVVSSDPTEIVDWVYPTLAEARAMSLSRSLANARAEYREIIKNEKGNTGNRDYYYATLHDTLDAVIDILAKYEIEIATEITFASGDWMFLKMSALKFDDRRVIEWPIGKIEAKNQTNGMNLTYARRYAFSALLNLAPDDDTDGQSDETDNGNRSRRDDRGSDRYDDRRSNFDDRSDRDGWRRETEDRDRDRDRRDEGRSQNDDQDRERAAVQQRKVRSGPDKGQSAADADDQTVSVALDSLSLSSNKRTAEAFWDAFKKKTTQKEGDVGFDKVKALYIQRWKIHAKEEEAKKDPLNASGKAETKVEPEVKPEEQHISPDEALGEIETLLENCTDINEFHALLEKHNKLFEAASKFGPDADMVADMKEDTLRRLKQGDSRTQRMDDVEDQDRNENARPDIGNERF